ncbi:glycerol-3-phosphate dehydrogenase [Sphingobacterium multivorum]|uniref:Glycerol-3-phosphate dehydrogenase n=1 Tax=Sphingobacterium multivorum TaxID=28454 RepID=A0A2X2IV64_SPHMU|nr:glycerol-3-phosphate dehydrogenase [Sphingobacterium multivorum]
MKHQEFNRSKLIEKIRDTSAWDVIVIGGGASGLGVALDALSRGFKTILLEQVDFAKALQAKQQSLFTVVYATWLKATSHWLKKRFMKEVYSKKMLHTLLKTNRLSFQTTAGSMAHFTPLE